MRKDALYCDRPDSDRRRACRTVMDEIFTRLTAWLSPLAAFTCEEAWTTRFPDAGPNALRVIPDTPAAWRNDAEAARWARVKDTLGLVTMSLEGHRRDKDIGSSLEAAPQVSAGADCFTAFSGLDAAEIFRTSAANIEERSSLAHGEVEIKFRKAEGEKCDRCWRILPEVKEPARLCLRCEDAVSQWDHAHA